MSYTHIWTGGDELDPPYGGGVAFCGGDSIVFLHLATVESAIIIYG